MAVKFKFTRDNFQAWKHDPEGYWRSHGVELTPEQQQWLAMEDWSQSSFEEFKRRVQRSKLWTGWIDWS